MGHVVPSKYSLNSSLFIFWFFALEILGDDRMDWGDHESLSWFKNGGSFGYFTLDYVMLHYIWLG